MISPRRALWERALARSQQELEAQIRRVRVPASTQERHRLAAAEHARDRVVFDAFEQGRLSAIDIAAALGTRVREARRIIEKVGLTAQAGDRS